ILLASLTGVDCSAANCLMFNFSRVVESYKLMVKHVRDGDLESARRQQNVITDEGQRHRSAANRLLSAKNQFNQDVKHLARLTQGKQKLLKFRGAMAPVLTPYDSKGEVNVSQIPAYVKYLVANKVDGVYICGTNGEGYNLTLDERFAVIKAWHQEIHSQKAGLLSVANVSSYCLKEAVDLSKRVEALGVDSIAVLPPNYYRPNSIADWVNFIKAIGTAAPNTPLLYYHIPSMAGELNVDLVQAIGEGLKQVPQLAAIKFTDGNVVRLSGLQQYASDLKVFLGFDQTLLTVMTALEYDSSISALWNLPELPEVYKRFLSFNGQLDLAKARVEQNRLIAENTAIKSTGNPILTVKLAFNEKVKHLGIDVVVYCLTYIIRNVESSARLVSRCLKYLEENFIETCFTNFTTKMSVLEQRKQKLLQFKGAMAAVITPYDKNGKVDVSQIGAYVKYLVDIGVNGVYIIGTTGEGYNLTNAERVELARAWRQALDKHRAPLLAVFNVSSNCWRESLDLSREVERLGFDAIAVLPPIYYKPNTVEDWVDALRPVAKAAPNTPLLYYHIPSMAGTFNFDIVDAIGEGIRQIPQLAAMKFTDDNVIRFLEIQKRHKNVFKIFIGFDQ
ncbi:unnamed protein product, partial [Medioppia subpectinata]